MCFRDYEDELGKMVELYGEMLGMFLDILALTKHAIPSVDKVEAVRLDITPLIIASPKPWLPELNLGRASWCT